MRYLRESPACYTMGPKRDDFDWEMDRGRQYWPSTPPDLDLGAALMNLCYNMGGSFLPY